MKVHVIGDTLGGVATRLATYGVQTSTLRDAHLVVTLAGADPGAVGDLPVVRVPAGRSEEAAAIAILAIVSLRGG